MSVLQSWLAWSNVPYLTVLAIAVLFAALQATGLLGLLAGGDHAGDSDADGDGAADGHDAHDGEAAIEAEAHGSFSIAGLLGIRRVPLTFALQAFAISLGIAGLSAHTLAYGASAPPPRALWWSAPLSLLIATAVTAGLARVAGRIFSTEGQEASRRSQLVGSTGVVISTRVDHEFGEVRLRAPGGVTVRVIVTTEDDTPIVEGREVVVTDFDRERDRLVVAALDEDQRARRRSGAA